MSVCLNPDLSSSSPKHNPPINFQNVTSFFQSSLTPLSFTISLPKSNHLLNFINLKICHIFPLHTLAILWIHFHMYFLHPNSTHVKSPSKNSDHHHWIDFVFLRSPTARCHSFTDYFHNLAHEGLGQGHTSHFIKEDNIFLNFPPHTICTTNKKKKQKKMGFWPYSHKHKILNM